MATSRLMFEPREELTIDFTALQIEVTPRADFCAELSAAFLEIWREEDGRQLSG